MLHLSRLFEQNVVPINRTPIKNYRYFYANKSSVIDEQEILRIISFLNKIGALQRKILLPVHFYFSRARFADKTSVVLLECICDYLISECNCKVYIEFCQIRNSINTDGFRSSPLWLLNDPKYSNLSKFHTKFSKEIYESHYRNIIRLDKYQDGSAASHAMQDIDSFLKYFQIDTISRQATSEVIAELLDNALEHASSDCLIDLDVTKDYLKAIDDPEIPFEERDKYFGINITIINFSEVLFWQTLKTKIETATSLPSRYDVISNAKQTHQQFWCEEYSKEDFYIISSFQHKISGRCDRSSTGGTGLTKLIKSLEERSDSYNCYLFTGPRKLIFNHEYLNYNEDGLVGFNSDNDYFKSPPDFHCLKQCCISMPGSAYNLNFVLKREVSENV